MTPADERLRDALQSAARGLRIDERLDHDPLGLVRSFAPEEREVVAHVAASLAYGAVAQLRGAIGAVLSTLGPSPTAALMQYQRGDFVRSAPHFVYRMTRAEDVDALLAALAGALQRDGSLAETFRKAMVIAPPEPDILAPLTEYARELRSFGSCERRGFRYLLSDPGTGSAAKRWHLMMRWLVRPNDGADLGLWTFVPADRLLLPLDTHLVRHVHALGLSQRRAADYRMAREATDALLRIDPVDPLRFDMALCHLGIARDCLHRFEPMICQRCVLRGACSWSREADSQHPG